MGKVSTLTMDPELSPASSETIGAIEQAVRRARELTRQLLLFGRQQVVEVAGSSLNRMVQDAFPFLSSSCAPNVPLSCELFTAAEALIKVQKPHVTQILQNLVFNARDAIVSSGVPGAIEISTSVSGGLVRLEVSDSGPGMPPEVAERVFEPYFTTKEPGSGTGMGLAIVSGLVLQSGGKIRVQTAPGRGARFTIIWALAGDGEAAVREARGSDPVEVGQKTSRIMFVDDEPEIRDLVRTLLTWQGFDVSVYEAAEAAAEAIEAAVAPPDLLITDVSMPGMDGGTLANLARARWPSVPILFVTGFSGGLLSQMDLAARNREVLEKPFDGHELGNKIREMLKR